MLLKRFDGTERRRHLNQLPVLDKLAHMPHYMGSQSIDRADIEP